MKRLFNILVFFVLSVSVLGQPDTRVVDSLQAVMANQEGKERVETMMELSRSFFDLSFDDCIWWGEKAIEEASRFGEDELVAKAYWKIGLRYLNHYEFDLALDSFDQALEILNDAGVCELLMDVLNYKGRTELLMGELDAAMSTYQRTLEVSEILGDALNCADVINNMAYIYFQQNEFDKSFDCFIDARHRYIQLSDTLSAAQCDNNISNIYVQRQQYDQAHSVLKKAIPLFEQYEDEASLAHAYQNLGTVFATGRVNLDSALYYLHKSIVCAENMGDQITLIEDEIELANVLKLLNREDEALNLYQSALHSSEAIGHASGILESYKNLGVYYNEKGDFTTSAVYLRRCMDLASEKGNLLYVNVVRPYLIADYARLGELLEMKKELGLMIDNYEGILNENNALDEELTKLRVHADGLLDKYESQSAQIESLQSQRNQYRLAFFGLLALVIAAIAAFVLWIIVGKNQDKNAEE